jgi:hypothetical protein
MTNPTPDRLTDLLGGLLGPAGPELTCEECFEHLDRYVEVELSGADADADAAVPGMHAHLDGCPACAEDHDSLYALVGSERQFPGRGRSA